MYEDWQIEESFADDELRLDLLDECLGELKEANASLVLAYHDTEGERASEHRERLARKANLTVNALRAKMCRLRQKLEDCVSKKEQLHKDQGGDRQQQAQRVGRS